MIPTYAAGCGFVLFWFVLSAGDQLIPEPQAHAHTVLLNYFPTLSNLVSGKMEMQKVIASD